MRRLYQAWRGDRLRRGADHHLAGDDDHEGRAQQRPGHDRRSGAGAGTLSATLGRSRARFQRTWTPVAFNERLRLYRYDIGQQFDWHRDGYFQRPNGERSFFTFMVYLNDDFDGGATSFSDDGFGFPGGMLRITPAKGMGLLF